MSKNLGRNSFATSFFLNAIDREAEGVFIDISEEWEPGKVCP